MSGIHYSMSLHGNESRGEEAAGMDGSPVAVGGEFGEEGVPATIRRMVIHARTRVEIDCVGEISRYKRIPGSVHGNAQAFVTFPNSTPSPGARPDEIPVRIELAKEYVITAIRRVVIHARSRVEINCVHEPSRYVGIP